MLFCAPASKKRESWRRGRVPRPLSCLGSVEELDGKLVSPVHLLRGVGAIMSGIYTLKYGKYGASSMSLIVRKFLCNFWSFYDFSYELSFVRSFRNDFYPSLIAGYRVHRLFDSSHVFDCHLNTVLMYILLLSFRRDRCMLG